MEQLFEDTSSPGCPILAHSLHIYPDGRMDTVNAAAYIGVSKKTMAQWRYQGGGKGPPFIKPTGGRVFYYKVDLDAWLNRFGRANSTAEAMLVYS